MGKIAPTQGPQLPGLIFEICMMQKGCGRIYNKLMNSNTGILMDVKTKWEMALNEEIPYDTVQHASKKISKIESGAYQKYFQFKLLHNRIITNEKLHNMGISDTKMCKTCLTEIDTLRNMFLECHTTINLWKQVEFWVKTVTSNSLKLTDFDKIFDFQQKDKTINKIILITKIVIYKNRISGKAHNIMIVKKMLYNELCVKEYELNINDTVEYFIQVWGQYYQNLKETFFPNI